MNKTRVAKKLLKMARQLLAIGESPYKTKQSMERLKPVITDNSYKVLHAVLNLMPGAELVMDDILMYSQDTSHKFHYFAMFKDGDRFVCGNAWGRIGGNISGILIAEGPDESKVREVYYNKMRRKMAKGYNKT